MTFLGSAFTEFATLAAPLDFALDDEAQALRAIETGAADALVS